MGCLASCLSVYVHKLIVQIFEEVLGNPTCEIFVCGHSRMLEAVSAAMTEIIGFDVMSRIVSSGRFHEDVFGFEAKSEEEQNQGDMLADMRMEVAALQTVLEEDEEKFQEYILHRGQDLEGNTARLQVWICDLEGGRSPNLFPRHFLGFSVLGSELSCSQGCCEWPGLLRLVIWVQAQVLDEAPDFSDHKPSVSSSIPCQCQHLSLTRTGFGKDCRPDIGRAGVGGDGVAKFNFRFEGEEMFMCCGGLWSVHNYLSTLYWWQASTALSNSASVTLTTIRLHSQSLHSLNDLEDTNGNGLLHMAALLNKPKAIRFLVDQGMTPNAMNSWGLTPLAVANASPTPVPEAVECLQRLGAPLCTGLHSGFYPVHTCILTCDLTKELERVLGEVKHVDDRDFNGCTPLHLATRMNKARFVRVLLEHGADPNAQVCASVRGEGQVYYGSVFAVNVLTKWKSHLPPGITAGSRAFAGCCVDVHDGEASGRLCLRFPSWC